MLGFGRVLTYFVFKKAKIFTLFAPFIFIYSNEYIGFHHHPHAYNIRTVWLISALIVYHNFARKVNKRSKCGNVYTYRVRGSFTYKCKLPNNKTAESPAVFLVTGIFVYQLQDFLLMISVVWRCLLKFRRLLRID